MILQMYKVFIYTSQSKKKKTEQKHVKSTRDADQCQRGELKCPPNEYAQNIRPIQT